MTDRKLSCAVTQYCAILC